MRKARAPNPRLYLLMLIILFFLNAFTVYADQITNADTPYIYGEESFLRRIAEKAEGRTPIGLVLSGGSARAFAHIGVLRRMEELGIVPDYIVANSMGSIVGLLYGAGFSPDQIDTIIRTTNIAELFKLALPIRGGLIDTAKFTGLISRYTGNPDISELPIPVMVLCEDLKTKRQVWIGEGDFLTVIQASYALPFYFNPVKYGDHLLIDGGVANLVPLDTAYKYSDCIIASTTFYQNPQLNLRNPITNINVALDIGKSRTGVAQIKKYNPLWIRCDVESFSFMEFDSMGEIQTAGYHSADAMSGELKALPASGIGDDLREIRRNHTEKIEEEVFEYHYLESLPVVTPVLLVSIQLKTFYESEGNTYLNRDLQYTGGIDFSAGFFNVNTGLGGGIDMGDGDIFPLYNITLSHDFTRFLRAEAAYTLRFEPEEFTEYNAPEDLFRSADLYAGLQVVPIASTHFKQDVSLSAEASFRGIDDLNKSLLTVRAGLTADSRPSSEENYSAELSVGYQLSDLSGPVHPGETQWFVQGGMSLPVPGTAGLLLLKGRGFGRMGMGDGYPVPYYFHDGMRSSLGEGSYDEVKFASADLILNPYRFRPAFAETIMVKEIELGIFGSAGVFDRFLWSSGVSLSFDMSLIGLKPLRIRTYTAYEKLSSGITGGILLIQKF